MNDGQTRTVEISLDEVKRLFLLLEELNAFFHQPMHYPDVEAVKTFLGNQERGAYKDIHDMYYNVVWNWLPSDVQEEIHNR